MYSDMPDYEWYTFIALLVGFVLASLLEGNGKRKLCIAVCFLCIAALGATDAFAGDKKYNSKGAGQSKRPVQTVMERQQYADWLKAGCPPLIQAPQPQPKRTK